LDLLEVIKKHKAEKFLFPCSNKRQKDLPDYMGTNDYQLTEAIMYETVSADLSDLENVFYDIIAFFSPSGITSLFENFPDFKQNNTRIAAFGPTTAQAATNAELIIDIQAPMPNAPSMTGALEYYIKMANK
jgi:uroporphyrinogen-III synthase